MTIFYPIFNNLISNSGFGVCCQVVFSGCGGTVTRNCSYIQNADYPGTTTTAQTCKFIFQRESNDICFIRLDFDVEVAAPTANNDNAVNGDCTTDVIQMA